MRAQGNKDEALAEYGKALAIFEYRRAISLFEQLPDPDPARLAEVRVGLASAVLAQGRADEALELAETAWDSVEASDGLPDTRATGAWVLASALWQTRPNSATRQRARALLERARKHYVDGGAPYAGRLATLDAWIEEHGLSEAAPAP